MNPEQVARDAVAKFNAHDVDGFLAHYAPGAVVHDPTHPEPLATEDAIRQDMIDFFTAFPDTHLEIDTLLAAGNRVAFNAVGTGTHGGPLVSPQGEVPATNRPVRMDMAVFVELTEDGKIVEEHRYFDLAGMFAQLGLA